MRTIEEIVQRKREGIDCTADESCVVLGYFDTEHNTVDAHAVSKLFPLEWDQWNEERERGDR